MSDRRDIVARIDSALERARLRGDAVRAICLSDEDWAAWNAVRSAEWGSEVVSLSFRDHPIRQEKHSAVWTKVGVGITIPKRLSAKVVA